MHGTGFFRARHAYRLAHDFGNGVGIADRRVPLGHRLEHLLDIHDLVRFLVQSRGGTLPGQRDQRRVIHVGVGHAGQQVGRTRPQCAKAARRIAGQAAIDLGHECRALFMPGQDEADLLRLFQRQHEVGILFAGHAEDIFDAFVLEALNQQIGCFHRVRLLGVGQNRITR